MNLNPSSPDSQVLESLTFFMMGLIIIVMLLLLISFANFNPHIVMEGRKSQFLNAIDDIAAVARSDSISLSYFWKNGYDFYRINVNKSGQNLYYILYDSEKLWKITREKRRKEPVSFFEGANLWMYDWLYFLPDDFKWKRVKGGLALLEYECKNAHFNLWVDDEGRIWKVRINSEYGKVEIEYKDFTDLEGFPYYPKKWIVKGPGGNREFKVDTIHVNRGFCTPCTFKVPNF